MEKCTTVSALVRRLATMQADFTEISRGAGYHSCMKVSSLDELQQALAAAATCIGPTFLEVDVSLGTRPDLGRPTVSTLDAKVAFMAHLRDRCLEE